MPSNEQEGGQGPEQEPTTYYKAAHFAGEEPARRAYFDLQKTIFEAQCGLSSYRLQVDGIWHVAVLGEPPPEDLENKVKAILSTGEPTPLTAEVLKLLQQRRAQATKQGPWFEAHYRPGKRL